MGFLAIHRVEDSLLSHITDSRQQVSRGQGVTTNAQHKKFDHDEEPLGQLVIVPKTVTYRLSNTVAPAIRIAIMVCAFIARTP